MRAVLTAICLTALFWSGKSSKDAYFFDEATSVPGTLAADRAGASDVDRSWRTIDRLPYVIDRPGNYRLAASLESASDGIVVRANRVTIDGRFQRLAHRGTPATRCCGIRSDGGCSDVVVRNIWISGFFYNVRFDEDYERLRLDHSASARHILLEQVLSTDAYFRGIRLDACEATVRRCTIRLVGGTSVFADAYVMGIEVYGPRNTIAANSVADVRSEGRGEGVGISVSDFGDGTRVIDNRIENRAVDGSGDIGIWVGGRSSAHLCRNRIARFDYGVRICCSTFLGVVALEENRCQGCASAFLVDDDYVPRFRSGVRAIPSDAPNIFRVALDGPPEAPPTTNDGDDADPRRLDDGCAVQAVSFREVFASPLRPMVGASRVLPASAREPARPRVLLCGKEDGLIR